MLQNHLSYTFEQKISKNMEISIHSAQNKLDKKTFTFSAIVQTICLLAQHKCQLARNFKS